MPVPEAEPCWTGNCTCPKCERRTGIGVRRLGCRASVSFHTKGQLAQLMLQRAVESGVSFAWVAGDEVYGNDRKLRL